MAGRSKIETALYESFVKGEMPRPVAPKPAQVGLTSSVQIKGNFNDGGAGQLINALSKIAPELQQMAGQMADRETVRQMNEAKKQYLSMTLEERKALTESGQLAQFDPVYQAMFSRLWGEDVARKSKEEIVTGLQTGNLKFGSSEELDKFLEDRRKQDLTNYQGNEYALAGYDTHFNQLRQEAGRVNSYLRGQEKRASDTQLAQSQLIGVAKETSSDPLSLMVTYRQLQQAGHYTDIEMHKMMSEVAQTLARQGKTKELESLLGSKFAKDENFGSLGDFLGDNAEVLKKNAEAVDLNQARQAFEETFTDLRQAAHNGKLASVLGVRSVDPKSLYGWIEKKTGRRDILEPTQMDSLIQMNASSIERQLAEAERAAMRAQMAKMRAALQQNALAQAQQFGRAGVTDQVTVDANGVTHVVSADTLYTQAALTFNQQLAQEVKAGKKTTDQAFVEQLNFYGKGGNNPEWEDRLKHGVGAFSILAANPNDENAKKVAMGALDLYARLKGSGAAGLEGRHVNVEARKLLEAGVVAQRMNLNPVDVIGRVMQNPDAPVKVTGKELLKAGIPEGRLREAMDFAHVLNVGMGMPEREAVKEAKRYTTEYALKVNGSTVFPITRQMTLEDQQAAAQRLLKGYAEQFKAQGVTPDGLVLDSPNAAAGFYSVRVKGAFAPLRDAKGNPVVITKEDLLKERAAEEERQLVARSKKALDPNKPKPFFASDFDWSQMGP